MKHVTPLLLLGVMLWPALARGAEPYECRYTERPITIDGAADEEAWRDAVVIDAFRLPWLKTPRAAKTATRARLLWDRENLYFYAEMDDADLTSSIQEQDGRLWEGDVFELFFKPSAKHAGYYEFQVNPHNAVLDMFLPARSPGMYERHKSDRDFNLRTAVKLRGTLNKSDDVDEGWAVEGAIPWRSLAATGGRPVVDEAWAFTLCRYDYAAASMETPELSATAPLSKADFHLHEDYAPIRFTHPGPSRKRATWENERLRTTPEPPLPYRTERLFPNLTLKQPIYVRPEPGTRNMVAVQHLGNWAGPGRLVRFDNDPKASSAEVLLDLNYLVYGFCFHPRYEENGYVYLVANGPVIDKETKFNRIFRYTIDRQTRKLDPASRVTIIEWESDGHNGGECAFGPDGMFYVCAGDGTSDSDTNLRGQDTRYLTSAMIRIDLDRPDAGRAYSVPKDNPFLADKGVRPEIYAFGFRNPWRMTFDAKTGHLWVGNNGQDLWEQVYLVKAGANYGWSLMEGGHPFQPKRKQGPAPISGPIIDHPHSEFRSLTGGIVYYGQRLPELNGAYVYGDFSTGRIWAARTDGTKLTWHKELADTPFAITGFAQDQDGELIVVDQGSGFHRLVPAPVETGRPAFPARLSETGLFLDTKAMRPHPAMVPYSVNAPLWSDGAAKERYLVVPGGGRIDYTFARGWGFPEGSVLVKSFFLDVAPGRAKRLETRLLVKQQNEWQGYTYLWNDAQDDATLAPKEGLDREYTITSADGTTRTQRYHFPSRTECMVCHSRAANYVLGPTELQMNRDHDYGGGRVENQLAHLESLGMLKVNYMSHARDAMRWEAKRRARSDAEVGPVMERHFATKDQRPGVADSPLLPARPAALTRLVDPYDAGADLDERARAYLHSNCAQCHVEAGGGNAKIDLEYYTPAAKMSLFDELPQHHSFGLPDARLVAPGRPEGSILLHRVAKRGEGQMPQLGTHEVDAEAVKLLHEWVTRMK